MIHFLKPGGHTFPLEYSWLWALFSPYVLHRVFWRPLTYFVLTRIPSGRCTHAFYAYILPRKLLLYNLRRILLPVPYAIGKEKKILSALV